MSYKLACEKLKLPLAVRRIAKSSMKVSEVPPGYLYPDKYLCNVKQVS